MKAAVLLAILTLTMNIAYAKDEPAKAGNASADYCAKQAEMSGIEDENELRESIQDCIASFTAKPEVVPAYGQE